MEIPICVCFHEWPYGGHRVNCPVRKEIEDLREKNAALIHHIEVDAMSEITNLRILAEGLTGDLSQCIAVLDEIKGVVFPKRVRELLDEWPRYTQEELDAAKERARVIHSNLLVED